MKKHLSAVRIAAYLFCLSAAGALVVGTTYAFYSSSISGSAKAKTASFALDVTDSKKSQVDLTAELAGMSPSQDKEITFAVTNTKDGTVSEVAQEYSITITTTGNLPLTYELHGADASAPEGSYVTAAGPLSWSGNPISWSGGLLPLSSSGSVTHTYVLTVTWPSDSTDEKLSDEIDLVTMTVDAKQALPETAP